MVNYFFRGLVIYRSIQGYGTSKKFLNIDEKGSDINLLAYWSMGFVNLPHQHIVNFAKLGKLKHIAGMVELLDRTSYRPVALHVGQDKEIKERLETLRLR